MSELTFEQRLHNALGSQEIENIKARHSFWHGMGYSREEWDNIWHKSGDTTWGHFFGRMVGWDEVWNGSIIDSDSHMYEVFTDDCIEDPELSHFDVRATGVSSCHNLGSPIIEVAADGKSARASYLTPGQLPDCTEYTLKKSCEFFYERYGSDFVYEEDTGKWVYFHEQVCPDMMGNLCAENYGHTIWEAGKKGQFFRGGGMAPDNITEPGPIHQDLCPIQLVQRTTAWPEPYETLDNDNTFSPNHNNPDKPKVEWHRKS